MTDFATLVLGADSAGLRSGEQDLKNLASTAAKAEAQAGRSLKVVSNEMEAVGKKSAAASHDLRQASMQLSQVAQQAAVTGDWVQALAIQLPDLALGFGPIGIAAGVAAGAILPLAANLVMAGEEANELEEAFKGLKEATDQYADAVENAGMSSADLIDTFGSQAEAAQKVYDALRKIREIEFNESLNKAQEAVSAALSGISDAMDRFNQASSLPDFLRAESLGMIRTEVQYLGNEFGLTLIQATRINEALDQLAAADGPGQAADAAMRLGNEIGKAADEGAKLTPAMVDVQKSAYEAALDAAKFANLTGAAVGPTNSLANAAAGVANEFERAASFAAALTGRFPSQGVYSGVERSADSPIQGESFSLPDVGPTPTSRGTPELSGFPWERLTTSRSGARSRGGRGKSDADSYKELVQAAEQRIQSLEVERQALEMTEAAAAKLRYETDLFQDAQRAGIELAPKQEEQLRTLADTMARVEEETRLAAEQQDFFNDLSEDLKNGILDAAIEGKNLSDVFEGLAKSIARAALEAALFNSGPFASAGGGSGGGGLLGSLFGGLFGGKLFSFDGGGSTGSGSRSGGLDGKGGFMALLHPNETVIDHTKGGGGASGMHITFGVSADSNGNILPFVENVSEQKVKSAAPGIVRAANSQVVPTMAKYQTEKVGGDYRLG